MRSKKLATRLTKKKRSRKKKGTRTPSGVDTKGGPAVKGQSGDGPKVESTASSGGKSKPKRRPLTSFAVFELCVERAKNLIKLHSAAHGKAGKPEKWASDAHRAAIVLAVSALDAFVRDFVISRTRTLLASKSLSLPGPLSDKIKRLVKEDGLLEAARKDDLLDRVEKALRGEFEKRSFQGTKNIQDELKIVGYDDIFHEVAVKANMNEDTLRSDIDRFTRRRHEIAHRGDYDLSENPPKEKSVTKKDAEECVKLVCRVARYIHEMPLKGE